MNKQNSTLAERIGTITRSIASGSNACGTLMSRDGRINTAFIEASVRPTLGVYEGELAVLRKERDALLRDVETKRFALETAVANSGSLYPSLPGRSSAQAVGFSRFSYGVPWCGCLNRLFRP